MFYDLIFHHMIGAQKWKKTEPSDKNLEENTPKQCVFNSLVHKML